MPPQEMKEIVGEARAHFLSFLFFSPKATQEQLKIVALGIEKNERKEKEWPSISGPFTRIALPLFSPYVSHNILCPIID